MEREIKFRVYNGHSMEYNIMAGFLGTFYVQGMDEKDAASMSNMNTKYFDSVIPMQYTGLKDKNGKEIYEGDVLSTKWRVEVCQNIEGTWMVKFHNNPTGNKIQSLYTYLISRETAGTSDRDNCIIGNIYENPNTLTPK